MLKKKHNFNDLLKYMHLLENGYSIKSISQKYGICHLQLKRLWILYQEKGKDALVRKTNIRADGALKEKIVRDYLENHLSLVEISLKYNVSESRIKAWSRTAREQGYAALYVQKRRGRPPKDMGRPKKKEPQTELEKLQYENARLRAENDLLKKVKALVEARDARLREIGRKPSKN